jgi:hypothetical protein
VVGLSFIPNYESSPSDSIASVAIEPQSTARRLFPTFFRSPIRSQATVTDRRSMRSDLQ